MAYDPLGYRLLGVLKSANLNTTSDQAIPILNSAKYIVDKIIATNASTTPGALAAGGIYTTTSKGGTAVVGAGQVYTSLTGATKFTALTLALTTDSITASTLYLSLSVANGSACTCDLYIWGYQL